MSVTTTPTLTGQDVAALNDLVTESAKLIRNQDWDAWLATFVEDMILMPGDAPMVSGKEAAKAYLQEFPTIVAFTSAAEQIDGRGDYAAIRGRYSMTVEIDGEQVEDVGKWIVTGRKGEDGKWRGVWDIWNSDLEPPVE